jgi:hypothetical protein
VNDSSTQGHQYKYCTQRCLLGLVNRGPLDPNCPNTSLHQKDWPRSNVNHLIDHTQWLNIVQTQLQHILDEGVRPLSQSGARGVLFQLTLLAYGYTFIGKGTVQAFISDLAHEAEVYKRLELIQGVYVPVFLGVVDLRSLDRTYYYLPHVHIIHMTFMSFSGDLLSGEGKHLVSMATTALRAFLEDGVIQKDVRRENTLFDSEVEGVMVIDFERAFLGEKPRLLSGNKRKRMVE